MNSSLRNPPLRPTGWRLWRCASHALLAAHLLLSKSILAAPTAPLTLQGTLTPEACNIQLSNGGKVDFGEIPSSVLLPNQNTNLGEKGTITLSIECTDTTQVAYRAIDNRAGTVPPGWQENHLIHMGLGTAAGQPIGAYRLFRMYDQVYNATVDGKPASGLMERRPHGSNQWEPASQHIYSYVETGTLHAYGTSATSRHIGKSYQETFRVHGRIARGDSLPLKQEINLDGSLTFELVYE